MSYLEGSEYDKIVVDKSPMEILWSLMSIERPCDEEVNLTSEQWYDINLAISLLMDTVGIHYNYKEKRLVYDNLNYDLVMGQKDWRELLPKRKFDSERKQFIIKCTEQSKTLIRMEVSNTEYRPIDFSSVGSVVRLGEIVKYTKISLIT